MRSTRVLQRGEAFTAAENEGGAEREKGREGERDGSRRDQSKQNKARK